ncbi:MAG: membrane protein insertase YidC [Sodaliphilus sp.]|nr:membrane protein insertase YidC [Bacteroidales bacterium]MDY2591676.1 membrane protein insertase YidC [Sodaliphilus sp.]MCI6145370.1 membrane protein insertase YidC [Bacteroidales bacterium]MCI6562230.1 membrane protein insertase YidC [Bacteroidales bacterium]MCI6576907.1 membrane protein insertase YidC [Bacteroidales bacterium]
MDKNTIIGLLLMMAVIFGFNILFAPSEEEIAQQKQEQVASNQDKKDSGDKQVATDSLSANDFAKLKENLKNYGGDSAVIKTADLQVALVDGKVKASLNIDGKAQTVNDAETEALSPAMASALRELNNTYTRNGDFSAMMTPRNDSVVIKNDSLQLVISSKGAMITRATLPNYKSSHNTSNKAFGKYVEVFSPGENEYGFMLNTSTQRYNTQDFYFEPVEKTDSSVLMALNFPNGAQFGIRYTLRPDNYVVHMEVVQKNMNRVLDSSNPMYFDWKQKMRRHEVDGMFEERNSTLYYKFVGDDDADYLTESSEQKENFTDAMKWVAAKNQYFSSVFIAQKQFSGMTLTSVPFDKKSPEFNDYLKMLTVHSEIEYQADNANPASFFLYLGPNRYKVLSNIDEMIKQYPGGDNPEFEDLHLTRLIPLGWTLFRWINTWVVIPVFDWLGSFIGSYGIIILILTILIKLVLTPLTIKSYRSQAVMKILAPDVKAINEKYPDQADAMKRQQKTMELYRSAGASMFGGCLPMLLQMPVLIAVFAFFPSCIELRGQSFLWAHDLSAPDAIVSWTTQIPLISSYFGNHISLFCLLMTATNILYTYVSMQSQSQNQSMPGMKWMMYLMPVFFLVFFNHYASGLSYYYFVSLLITIATTYAVRASVKEEDVRAKMAEYSKKPKKKSGWMARMEEMQRQQQAAMREQQKRGGGKKRR